MFRERAGSLPVLVLMAISALAPFLFRCFVTLDGPMHVLHACALKAAWFSGRYDTPDVTYSTAGRFDPSDLVVLPFTTLLGPERAHTAYVVICLLALGMGAFLLARAYRPKAWPLLLWVLPLSWNYGLVLGFLPFMLAVGCGFGALAWWVRLERITWRQALTFLIIAALLQWMHRIGGVLFIVLVSCHEAVMWRVANGRGRWRAIPRWLLLSMFGAIAVLVLYKVFTTVLVQPSAAAPWSDGFWHGLFELRPLLLLDQAKEMPYLLAFGALLLISLLAAVRDRWRSGNGWVPADALWVAALVLVVASVVLRSPTALLLYLPMRAQAIALLLLTTWAGVVVGSRPLAWTVGLLLLPLHVHRLHFLEERMSATRHTTDLAMAVVEQLPEHGVALNFVRDDNWLHGHLGAYAACSYRGVFFSPNEHLFFTYRDRPNIHLDRYSRGFQEQLSWLEGHVASGARPVIDHVVLFGHGAPLEARQQNLMDVLDRHYSLQWKNDYAEVWVLRPGT